MSNVKRQTRGNGGLRKKGNKYEGTYVMYRKDGTRILVSFTRDTINEINYIKAKLRMIGLLDNNVQKVKVDRNTNEILFILKDNCGTGLYTKKGMTVSEYMNYYLEEHRRKGVKGKVIEDTSFSSYVETGNIIKRYIGNINIEQLTRKELEEFIRILQDKTSESTVRKVRDMITSMMFFAKKDGVIEENILSEDKITIRQSKEQKKKKVIAEEDYSKFLNYCIEHKYYDLVFDFFTGARASEVCGVTWKDVDLENKVVDINKEYARVKKQELLKDGQFKTTREKAFKELKTKSSYRTLGLADKLVDILKKHKEEQKILAEKNNKVFSEDDWVFTTKTYEGFLEEYMLDNFKRTVNALKIKDYKELTVHCLRHTFCTCGIENGVTVEKMKELLGHANIGVTVNLYTHLSKGAILNASKDITSAMEKYID